MVNDNLTPGGGTVAIPDTVAAALADMANQKAGSGTYTGASVKSIFGNVTLAQLALLELWAEFDGE